MRIRTVILTVTLLLVGIPATATAAPAPPGPGVVAFTRGADIWTAKPDLTGAVRRIVNGQHAAVSPDGRRIAFERTTRGHPALWLATSTGTGQTPLVPDVHNVAWSPDGRRLVGVRGVWLVTVTIATRALTPIPDSYEETDPQWSPDGTMIISDSPYEGVITRRPDGSSRMHSRINGSLPLSRDWRYSAYLDNDYSLHARDVLTGADAALDPESHGLPSWVWPAGFTWGEGDDDVYVRWAEQLDLSAPPGYTFGGMLERALTVGTDPSFGGGAWPADSNGEPPAVSGLTATPGPGSVRLTWDEPDRAEVPDALGVEVRYALGAVPPATLADGLDGGRFLDAGEITGLAPDQQVALAVFSRDVTGHVGGRATVVATTPHRPGSTLSMSVSPRTVLYGGEVTITGVLTRADTGEPIAGAGVRMYDGADDEGVYTSRADGSVGVTFAGEIGATTYFGLSYPGDAEHGPASVRRRAFLVLRVPESVDHTRARAGTPVHIAAVPVPVRRYARAYLQTTCGGLPCTLSRGSDANSWGRVVFTVKAPPRGTSRRYRVMVPDPWDHVASYGGWITVYGA
jgi:WD40 repeat protein